MNPMIRLIQWIESKAGLRDRKIPDPPWPPNPFPSVTKPPYPAATPLPSPIVKKLTDDEVLEARNCYAMGRATTRELAEYYGVTRDHMRRVLTYKRRGNVK